MHAKFMSKQQVDALKSPMEEAYKNNLRHVLPNNGRQVNLRDDEPKKNQGGSDIKLFFSIKLLVETPHLLQPLTISRDIL